MTHEKAISYLKKGNTGNEILDLLEYVCEKFTEADECDEES